MQLKMRNFPVSREFARRQPRHKTLGRTVQPILLAQAYEVIE